MDAKFAGFGDKALPFLKALGFHQSREWFHENKPLYDEHIKQPLGDLIECCAARFADMGVPLTGTRKTSLYRVNRDIRFAKEKHPYNTHASAILTRDGTKHSPGFVYVHISNERSFIASGFYGLDGEQMRVIRQQMIDQFEPLHQILDKMAKFELALDPSEMLKRLPRGFDAGENAALADLLRLKHLTFVQELDGDHAISPALADDMVVLGQRSLEFLQFGWRALERLG